MLAVKTDAQFQMEKEHVYFRFLSYFTPLKECLLNYKGNDGPLLLKKDSLIKYESSSPADFIKYLKTYNLANELFATIPQILDNFPEAKRFVDRDDNLSYPMLSCNYKMCREFEKISDAKNIFPKTAIKGIPLFFSLETTFSVPVKAHLRVEGIVGDDGVKLPDYIMIASVWTTEHRDLVYYFWRKNAGGIDGELVEESNIAKQPFDSFQDSLIRNAKKIVEHQASVSFYLREDVIDDFFSFKMVDEIETVSFDDENVNTFSISKKIDGNEENGEEIVVLLDQNDDGIASLKKDEQAESKEYSTKRKEKFTEKASQKATETDEQLNGNQGTQQTLVKPPSDNAHSSGNMISSCIITTLLLLTLMN